MHKNIIVGYLVPLSILLPISVFLLNYKNAPTALRYLFYFLIATAVINSSALIAIRLKMRNLPLLHLYTMVETFFFLAYFRTIFKQQQIKKMLLMIIFIFPVLCIVNFIFFQDIFTFNTHTRPLEAIIITGFCLLYFYKSGFDENWLKSPINWINMGILFYFPVASIIFILANYFTFVKIDRQVSANIWDLHAILVLMMYLIWTKGFSLMKENKNDR